MTVCRLPVPTSLDLYMFINKLFLLCFHFYLRCGRISASGASMERVNGTAGPTATKSGGGRQHDTLQRVQPATQTNQSGPTELRSQKLHDVQDPPRGSRGRHLGGGALFRLPLALLRVHGRGRLRHNGVGRVSEGQPETSAAGFAPGAVQDRARQTEQPAEEAQRVAQRGEAAGSRKSVE